MKKLKKQVKGITLIALVVTIIVLLILAGVAINLSIGQNGIFSKAQDAANTWRNAETNEQLALQEGADLIDSYLGYNSGTTIVEAKSQNKFYKEDTTIKDDLDNEVRIPEGFKIANDSGTKVEEGIVIEDKDGNQFVWIPAKTGEGATVHTTKGDKTIVYTRTAYSSNVATGEIDEVTNSEKIKYSSSSSYFFSESLPNDEELSINANGGYYIGRYETGDKESTEAKTMRTSESNQTNTVAIQKNQAPYNYITIENAKTLAEGMSSIQRYSAKTKLVSSYAWDTAINLIQTVNENYGNSSIEGNYYDTTFDYLDINGIKKTKNINSDVLVPTGQTTGICNIYDMGGNIHEYTTETNTNDTIPYGNRGGYYYGHYQSSSSGCRNNTAGDAKSSIGFRITLYL